MNYNANGGKAITSNRNVLLFSLLFISLLLGSIISSKAQTVINGAKVLKDTTVADKKYKLYLGARGGKYIIRVSKSGREYKQYFKAK